MGKKNWSRNMKKTSKVITVIGTLGISTLSWALSNYYEETGYNDDSIAYRCSGTTDYYDPYDFQSCQESQAVYMSNRGDCVDCQPSTAVQLSEIWAQPLVALGMSYLGNKYNYKTNKAWAKAYQTPYIECTRQQKQFLDYNLTRGSNDVLPGEVTDMMETCGGMAGFGGQWGSPYGYGYGYGFGGSLVAGGYTHDYLAGLMGPNYGSGISAQATIGWGGTPPYVPTGYPIGIDYGVQAQYGYPPGYGLGGLASSYPTFDPRFGANLDFNAQFGVGGPFGHGAGAWNGNVGYSSGWNGVPYANLDGYYRGGNYYGPGGGYAYNSPWNTGGIAAAQAGLGTYGYGYPNGSYFDSTGGHNRFNNGQYDRYSDMIARHNTAMSVNAAANDYQSMAAQGDFYGNRALAQNVYDAQEAYGSASQMGGYSYGSAYGSAPYAPRNMIGNFSVNGSIAW